MNIGALFAAIESDRRIREEEDEEYDRRRKKRREKLRELKKERDERNYSKNG